MAKEKKDKKEKKKPASAKDIKIEVIKEEKPKKIKLDDKLADLIEEEAIDYPFITRGFSPSLRARPVAVEPLNINLESIQDARPVETETTQKASSQYISQQYELYKTTNYDIPNYPKQITSGPNQVNLKPSDAIASPGYPSQEDKKYQSKLEQETKKKEVEW